MTISMDDATARIAATLEAAGIPEAAEIAWAAVWLEACGYGGIALLAEALADERQSLTLARGLVGIDLEQVSCAFLAPAIIADVKANGRVFLHNVRHGLFILPFTVREKLGIGCPVDPGFAVGGDRARDPYAEKLAEVRANGLAIDDAALCALTLRAKAMSGPG